MAEFKFTGWQAALVGAGLLAFMAVRATTMGDMTGNEALMNKVRMEMMTEYVPYEVKKLEKAVDSGDDEAITAQAAALTTAELDIAELKASYPVYIFSTGNRQVVLKVRFTLSAAGEIVKDGVNYYLCDHNPLGNTWYIKHPTTEYRYYSNFIL